METLNTNLPLDNSPLLGIDNNNPFEILPNSAGGLGNSIPELIPLNSEIPVLTPFVFQGDVDRDEDVDQADANLLNQTRRDPLIGPNDPRDFNLDGRITGADIVLLQRKINSNTDRLAPVINAGLLNDTGLNTDQITADSSITGTVTDTSQITSLRAGFDNTAINNFINIRGLLNPDGTFSITPGQLEKVNNNNPLSEGQHTLHLRAKDQWGNNSFFDVTFTLDSTSPTITAFLANDSGSDNSDGITNNPEIQGTVSDSSQITSFKASFAGQLPGEFTDVLEDLQPDGSFFFDATKLALISRQFEGLVDGEHTLKLIASDAADNISEEFSITFTVDKTAPNLPNFDLDPASDSEPLGDGETTLEVVTLIGSTSANTTVSLVGTDKTTISNDLGEFQFSGIELELGDNNFTIQAIDNAGNTIEANRSFRRIEAGDTTPPEAPILDLVASSDTGVSNTDNLTNDTTPTLQITAEAGSTVKLFQNGTEIGETIANAQGLAEFTVETLADASYNFTATATDGAGNTSSLSSVLTVGIDTVAPNLPTFDLSPASDSDPDGDRQTTASVVTLVGQTAPNQKVTLVETGVEVSSNALGEFQFSAVALALGANAFTVRVTDAAGNSSEAIQTFTRIEGGDTTPPEAPILDLVASSDTGVSNTDNLTNDTTPTLEVTAEAGSTVKLFQNGTEIGETIANAQGLAEFSLDNLADGIYNFTATATDVAGNTSSLSSPVSVTIDTTAPTVSLFGTLTAGATTFDIAYSEAVSFTAFDTNFYNLTVSGGDNDGQVVEIFSVERVTDTVVRVTLVDPLETGVNYSLAIASNVEDLAGNGLEGNTSIDLVAVPPTLEIQPIDGEGAVSLSRKPRIHFSEKVDPATVTDESFYLIANGNRIAGRIDVSPTEEFALFIPDEDLPAATEVRLVVNGDMIMSRSGVAIDANLDGTAGGMATADFTTLSMTRIAGTDVFGYVLDSYNRNPDGSNRPIEGVVIRVDGLEGVFATTDANGFFELDNVPSPDFFVYIDASNAVAPAGTQYASLGKAFHSVPGQRTQLNMNGTPFDIFLPPMNLSDIKPLSTTENTQVGFGEESLALLETFLPNVDPEVWALTQVIFPPGAAQDNEGNAATQAVIVPVEPSRLPAPLPPGLDPKLVISIQAGGDNGFNREAEGGSTLFNIPAPVQFPNLDNLPPGSKATLWSFDHEAGHWVAVGLATVSADGKTVVTDPGVGVLAPGWHFVSPPLNWTGSGGPPQGNNPVNSETPPEVSVSLFASGDSDTLSFSFTPPPGAGKQPGQHQLPQGKTEPTRVVEIKVDGPFDSFYDNSGAKGLKAETFTLKAGDAPVMREAKLRNLMDILTKNNGGKPFDKDVLYGAKITITETVTLADGSTSKSSRIILPYLYVDQSDDKGDDKKVKFADTIEAGNIIRTRDFDLMVGGAPSPTLLFEGGNAADFTGSVGDKQLKFNPSAQSNQSSTLKVEVTVEGQTKKSSGGVSLEGKGLAKNKISLNKGDLKTTLQNIANGSAANVNRILVTDNEIALFDNMGDPMEQDKIADALEMKFKGLYSAFNDGIEYTASGGINFKWETLAGFTFGTSKPSATDDGVDNESKLKDVVKDRGKFGKAQQNFLLAQAMNPSMTTNVAIYVDNILEYSYYDAPFELSTNQLVNALAKTATHEGGHTLGLLHTAQATSLTGQAAEVQTITLSGGNAGSTFTLNFNGRATAALANMATAAQVQTALQALPNIGAGNVTVAGGAGGPYTMTFSSLLRGIDLPQISGMGTNGLMIAAATTTQGTGSAVYGKEVPNGADIGRNDLMAGGRLDALGSLSFLNNLSATHLLLSLKLGWTPEQAQRTLTNYVSNYMMGAGGMSFFDSPPGESDDADLDMTPISGPLLALFDGQDQLLLNSLDFGNVTLDGPGGAQGTQTLKLVNLGSENIVLNNLNLIDDTGAFTLTNVAPGTAIAPGEFLALNLTFDPLTSGDFTGKIRINSNDQTLPLFDFDLNGFGLDPNPVFDLSFENNNFGGLAVSNSSLTQQLLTITNKGAADLTFTPTVLTGNLDFSLGSFAGVQQTLGFGESLVIPVTFDPTTTGILPGTIQFVTNDPDLATFNQGIVGTGIPNGPISFDWGNDFVTIEYNNFVERTTSNEAGKFMFNLPTFTEYNISIFDPVSGLIAKGGGFTGPAAAFTDLTSSLAFLPSTAIDGDFDGLADDIEFAIGTTLNKKDTDNDGLSDFAEIQQGLDPLGGQGFPTGIIANLPLLGEAIAVVVEGSTDINRNQLAYVATGSHGLAIVDASKFNKPIVLGQLNLAGNATDVAVDAQLGIAAIATNSGGLQLVDVSDPMLPTLIQTVNITTSNLVVAEGLAYVASNDKLIVVDLLTGDKIDEQIYTGGTIDDIAISNNFLYTISRSGTSPQTVNKIALGTDLTTPVDTLVIQNRPTFGRLSLAAGGDYIYVGAIDDNFQNQIPGVTIIQDTGSDLVLVGPPSGITAFDVAPNGSGLVLYTGANTGGTGTADVAILDVSNPTDTNNFVRSFSTPGAATDIAIASGIAYVADGTGDLQVINYLSFDNQGQAPSVNISTPGADLNPTQPGVQVLAGSSVPIRADVTDDVQVRNVELLVNGQVVSNDVSFPFDLSAIALPVVGNSVTVQVRATDTGGNSSLSNLLTFDVVPDTFAPIVSSTTPTEGTRQRQISGISVRFNEAIDGNLLNLNGITLTNFGADGLLGGGDDVVVGVQGFQLSESGRTLFITPPDEANFTPGNYQLSLDTSIISDRAGNALAQDFTLNFTKRSLSDSLILGETISDSILQAGENQIFTFSADAGDRIFFDGISADSFNLRARLVSPSAVNLFSSQTLSSDRAPLSLIETGTYQLIIEGLSNGTGAYSFRLLDAEATPLALDTDIERTLDPGTLTDVFTFEAGANQRLFFDGLSNTFSSSFVLYGPANQFITSGNSSSDREILLSGAGTYTLAIQGSGTEALDYSFRLITPDTTTEALNLGATVNGNLGEPGEQNIYTFTGTPGQRLFFDGLDSDSGISARLIGPFGNNVSLFNSSTNSDSSPFSLLEAGTYQLIVEGFGNTEDYNFRLLDLGDATNLTLNTTVETTLDPGRETDLYQFTATAGQRLFLDSFGTQFNGSILIYGPGNQFITSQTLGFDRDFTLTGTGTYLLAVQGSNFNDTPVDYGLRLVNPETISNPLTLGEAVNGSLDETGETDIYTFTGALGQRLYFDGLDTAFTANASLFSPSGSQISLFSTSTSSDSSPFTLSEVGNYQLRITGDTGDYSFRLLNLADAEILTLNTKISRTLDPEEQTDIFTFEGTANQRLFLDALGDTFNASYVVYGPNNQFITSGSDRDVNLTSDGTYILAIQDFSFDDLPLDYSFRLITPETISLPLTLGETVNGTLDEPGETEIYTFTGTVGQRLYFDGLDSTFNTNASLFSPSGSQFSLFSTSTSFDSSPFILSEAGTYQLRITGNTGDYNFRLLDVADAEVLILETTITRTLDPEKRTDIFTFEGTANQQLFLDDLNNVADAFYYLYGPNNQFVSFDEGDRNITLSQNGIYVLAVQDFSADDTPLAYSFRLENPDITEATLTIGNTINGSIDNAGDQIRYAFTGTAGQRLIFDGLDTNFNFKAALISPSGSGVSLFGISTDSDSDPFSLIETGTYELILDGNGDSTGDFSFRLLDLASATDVTLGSTVNGSLDPSKEGDLYQLNLQAGQTILIDGLGTDFEGSFILYQPNNQFFGSQFINSDQEYTINGDGIYTLLVQGSNVDNLPVDYSFQVSEVSFDDPGDPVGTALTFGETISSDIGEVDEEDVYLFDATAGQRIYVDGLDNNFSFNIRLISPSNQQDFSFFANTSNNSEPVSLLETGTYQLIVSGVGNVGDYKFRVLDVADATTLTLDTTITNTLNPGRETDLFQFEGTVGQRLFFDSLGQNQFNSSVVIYGPRNQFITAQNFGSDFDFTVPGDGTYLVAVQGFSFEGETIDYSFRLITPDTISNPLTIGEIVSSDLSEVGETDIYTFTGTVGQRLYFDGLDNTFSTNAQLFGPTGNNVFFNSFTSSDSNPFTITEAGTYQLRLTGDIGDYNFRLLDLNDATDLAFDTVISDTLDPGRETDIFKFTGTAGQRLFLDGLGTQFGGSIIVYGPNNQFITSNTIGFDNNFTLSTDGTYLFAVQGSSVETIDYSFRLITPDTISNPLTLGATVSTNLSELGETDIYTFTGTIGQRLYFDGLDSTFGINAQLFSPTGNNVFFSTSTSSDSSPFTLTEAGTYQLRLTGNIGAYNFRLLDLNSASNLAFDTVTNGMLDPGRETDVFKFTGTAGQRLFFDGLGTQFGGSFLFYGPNNQLINSTSIGSSDIDITLTSDGTYFLLAAGFNNTSVNYSFEMVTPQTSTTAINLGETVNGNISERGELDIFTFTANAGQRLYYDGLTGNFNIDASLLSQSGASVFSFQDSNGNRAPVTLIENGTYQIRLDGSGATTGAYSFRLLDGATAENLPFDTTITRTLNPGTSTALYQFTGTNGQTLFLDGLGTTGGGSIVFYRPDGQVFTSQTIGFDRDIVLPGNGTYLVAVEGTNASNSVNYSFQLNEPEFTTIPLTVGNTINGSIAEPGAQVTYTFAGTAGQRLYFDGLSSNSNFTAQLVSPSEQSLFSVNTNDDRQPLTLIEDGTYRLTLDTSGATTGNYNFRFFDAATVPTLNFGATLEGTLTPGNSSQVFKFQGSANQTISLTNLGSQSGGSYLLYGPGNQLIISRGFTQNFEVTLPGEGDYLLILDGSSSNSLNYRFQVV